jgi:signal peptidase I
MKERQVPPSQRSMSGSRAVVDRQSLWRDVKQILVAIAIVLVSRTVLAQPFYVPSGSMEPTLQIGDELLASKYAYGYSRYSLPLDIGRPAADRLFGRLPQRGDVVVFRLPRDPDEVYVKRVVGLPGDRLQMRAGHLWINGSMLPLKADGTGQLELQDGRSVEAPRFIETLPDGGQHPVFKLGWNGPLDNTPVYEVPPGSLFMMGDNRDNSLDSRVPAAMGGVGFVPVENLVGRADLVLGSWNFLVTRQPIWTWLSGVRTSRFFSRIG